MVLSTESDGEESLFCEATVHFLSRNYENCDEVVNKLVECRPNDTTVLMNKALLDYVYKYKYTRTEEFVNEIRRIATIEGIRFEENNECVVADDINSSPDKSTSDDIPVFNSNISKFVPTIACKSSITINLMYNYAVALFYQRHFNHAEILLAKCLDITSNLNQKDKSHLKPKSVHLLNQPSSYHAHSHYSIIQMIDVTPSRDIVLCRRILLLWLETLFRLFQTDCVYYLCRYWLMCINSKSLLSSLNPGSSLEINTSTRLRHLNSHSINMLRGIRRPLQIVFIRACLLTGRLSTAESEINTVLDEEHEKTLSERKSSEQSVDTETSCSASSESNDATHLSLVDGTSRINGTSHSISDEAWDTRHSLLYLRAQLAYLKDNYSGSMKRLADVPSSASNPGELGYCKNSMLWNNLALIHHRVGQFNISGLHLRRAMKSVDKKLISSLHISSKNRTHKYGNTRYISNISQIPLHAFSLIQNHELIYNLGLQLLFANKSSAAFTTLVQLVHNYPQNPRLWFRLAECCIKLHRPNNLRSWQLHTKESVSFQSVGSGSCRKLMFVGEKQEAPKAGVDTPSVPAPTLEFALLALRNVSSLLPKPPIELLTNNKSLDEIVSCRDSLIQWANEQCVPVHPSTAPLRGLALLQFYCATYANMAYISLHLNNPVDAIHASRRLIDFKRSDEEATLVTSTSHVPCETNLGLVSPKAYKYLCILYYSEALILMNRVNKALSLIYSPVASALATNNVLNSVIDALGNVCMSYSCLLPITNGPQFNIAHGITVATAEATNKTTESPRLPDANETLEHNPTNSVIRPIDFPANPVQATGLYLYNLATVLAIDKQYEKSDHYLNIALPALYVPMYELDGRKWSLPSTASELDKSKVLPLQAVLLRLYLHMVLGNKKQALNLVRQHFSSQAYAGRLNLDFVTGCSVSDHDNLSSDCEKVLFTQTMPELIAAVQHQTRVSDTLTSTRSVNSQPTNLVSSAGVGISQNLWTSGQQFKPNQPHQMYSSLSQAQTSSIPVVNYGHAIRWEQHQHQQASTTGLITAINESDWPPL